MSRQPSQGAESPLIFAVHRRGLPGSPSPRCVRTSEHPDSIFGYFENEHGEPMIFEYDTRTREGRVSADDFGTFPVVDGVTQGVNLNPIEAAWIALSWKAATKHQDARSPVAS